MRNLSTADYIGLVFFAAILVLIAFCLTMMVLDPTQFNSVGGSIVK